jgi:glycosyltransferase involved in cell wall biosynthesis
LQQFNQPLVSVLTPTLNRAVYMDRVKELTTPLVSIWTPTWNRAALLERVWSGLNSQTYKHIEWIIGNDGSTDETADMINELASRSGFPVSVITASTRVGKARMDNEGIARARGEFIVECDSDDYLLPDAVEVLVDTWNSIPESDREDFFGVFAWCRNEQNVASPSFQTQCQFDSIWNDLADKFDAGGDMVSLIKSKEWRAHPFPEVDFVIPEGITWAALGHKKIRVCRETLKITEYKASCNSISFSGRMEYCRGRAYALASIENNTRMYRQNLRGRWWQLITFIRCSMHGEIDMRQAAKMWGQNSSLSAFILMIPVAFVLALKDRMQGKVRMTHRDFIAASRLATIKYMPLSKSPFNSDSS